MSADEDKGADGVEAIPVYDAVTSDFMWIQKPKALSDKPQVQTYSIEVRDADGNPMSFIAGDRVVRSGKL
jgi:hypothetical protein